MKGFIGKSVCVLGLAAGAGCYGYHDLVDPCYPQRYNYEARTEVNATFAAQVANGHALDQTIWNYEFEPGTASLTPAGIEHLALLARRRPCPDPTLYLQIACDINYDPARFADFVEQRTKLDNRRIRAIQDYLTADTAGRHVAFNVVRHDPSEVGMSGLAATTSVRVMDLSTQGILRPGGSAGGSAAPAAPK